MKTPDITQTSPRIVRSDFLDDRPYPHLCRATAYRFAIRVARQGGCNAHSLRTLREMMRYNAKDAVTEARRVKARTLRLAA